MKLFRRNTLPAAPRLSIVPGDPFSLIKVPRAPNHFSSPDGLFYLFPSSVRTVHDRVNPKDYPLVLKRRDRRDWRKRFTTVDSARTWLRRYAIATDDERAAMDAQ